MGSNPAGGMDVCRNCCVLSGRGLCDGLITRPEESYRLWCVVVCDLEKNLRNEEAMAHDWAASDIQKEKLVREVQNRRRVINVTC